MDTQEKQQGKQRSAFARKATLAGMALTVGFMMLIVSAQRSIPWLAWLSILFFFGAAAHFAAALFLKEKG